MPLRLVQEEVRLVTVIVKIAYAEGWRVDYPNLAAKAKNVLHDDLRRSSERTKVPRELFI
jgi:hypothetical protein